METAADARPTKVAARPIKVFVRILVKRKRVACEKRMDRDQKTSKVRVSHATNVGWLAMMRDESP